MQKYRIAIVGAASLKGKEVNDALNGSSLAAAEFLLMDDEEALGQLEAAGDEITFIQRIEPTSFERVDYTFFAGPKAVTEKHWKAALAAGSTIVDLTYALENEPGALVRAPWVKQEIAGLPDKHAVASEAAPDLKTPAVVPAHPAAVVLALLIARLAKKAAVRSVFATVMEPASEHGRAAMDELHQQTVSLLSFQTLPKAIYDEQVAFNVTATLGEGAKVNLPEIEARIRRHYASIGGGSLPELGLQLLQAPVFHGYVLSVAVELEGSLTQDQIEASLSGEHVDVMVGDEDAPGNVSAAGQEDIAVRVRLEPEGRQARKVWLWVAIDNLQFAALNAVACATELRGLRPLGTVQ